MPRFLTPVSSLAVLAALTCSSCASVQSSQVQSSQPVPDHGRSAASTQFVAAGVGGSEWTAVSYTAASVVTAAPAAEEADVANELAEVPVETVALANEPVRRADETLIAVAVAEPALVEDAVQLRAVRAPVRMELSQTRRRVVLLPGVGAREPAAGPDLSREGPGEAGLSSLGADVAYARAVVVVGDGGRREVRYVDVRASPLDLGADAGCGAGAVATGLRLRGVRASALRLGMRGEAVRAAQQLLCAAGYGAGADGVFDRDVDQAVRRFQRDHNASGRGRRLSVDGALGYQTRQALEAAVAARSVR